MSPDGALRFTNLVASAFVGGSFQRVPLPQIASQHQDLHGRPAAEPAVTLDPR
jgi:hypothetical protein